MEITAMASFINRTFATYDYTLLQSLHGLAENFGSIATPFLKFISLLGEDGLFFILMSVVFMLFKKTRKLGICMFGAIGCGAIITNFVLKDFIARPRPFMEVGKPFKEWWQFVGAEPKESFSFPSGHVTATMAAMLSVFLICNKKYSWLSFILVILMGISRNYLMVHYPSDVLAGFVAGAVASLVAFLITNLIYKFLEKYNQNKFCMFVKDFDLIKFFQR